MSFLNLAVLTLIPLFVGSVYSQSSQMNSPCRPCLLSMWSSWGACSARCGPRGVKWRERRVVRQSNCPGKCSYALRQQSPCNRKCYRGAINGGVCVCQSGYSGVCCERANGGWSSWGPWGRCGGNCGTGRQSRKRTCTSSPPSDGGARCFGAPEQFRSCLLDKPCAVDGGWSKWGAWGRCTGKCKSGVQVRKRTCTRPPPANGGKKCRGRRMENKSCPLTPCPVDGQWNAWGNWSNCSKTCGGGSAVRNRSCSNPPPSNGGRDCCGTGSEEKKCNAHPCPVNGAWSPWEAWGDCTKSCGGGNQTRSRSCTNPPPSSGGDMCPGTSKGTRACNLRLCPVDGGWSSWGDWAECSKSCSGGMKWRLRNCTRPPPSNGGRCCRGDVIMMEKCNRKACPVNGAWSSWESWGQCDRTCGGGRKVRLRNCTNPAPSHGGKVCPGKGSETRECNTAHCPVHGGWSSWGKWTVCDKTCGGGIQLRTRNCTNPPPTNGGLPCAGTREEDRRCNNASCPEIDGGWSAWGAWGRCSVTCGSGVHQRQRNCTNPPPSANGRPCNGSDEQAAPCDLLDCSESTWSPWSQWSQCSEICNGTQTRNRTCLLCGRTCSQPSEETRSCNSTACVVHYDKMGCYKDGTPRAFPMLLKNFRGKIDWGNMNKTVYKCGQHARYAGFEWFGLQFFGECWSGHDAGKNFDKYGPSNDCWEGVGSKGANYVYRLKP